MPSHSSIYTAGTATATGSPRWATGILLCFLVLLLALGALIVTALSPRYSDGKTASSSVLMPSSELDYWRLPISGKARATLNRDGQALKINVQKADGTIRNVQCSQRGIDLEEGKAYTLRFRAAASATRTIAVQVQLDQPDYHTIGLRQESVALDTDWRTFFFSFRAVKVLPSGSCVAFLLGNKVGDVWLSDISVQAGRPDALSRLGWTIRDHPGAWATAASVLLVLTLGAAQGAAWRPTSIRGLGVAVCVSAFGYMAWRIGVINWQGWWLALPLLCAELFGVFQVLGLQYTIRPRRPEPTIAPGEDPTQRPIFVLIPTVNEGVGILKPTIHGAQAARECFLESFPHAQVTIAVCNDGRVANAPNWREVEALAQDLGVLCVTREVGGGAKAGNIEYARQRLGATGDSLVAIFDADMVAKPEFLLRTIPPFAAHSVGWVQTGQYYRNHDNAVARWADDQQALFYEVICPGKAADNAAFICGTNVVVRAAALDEIGGFPQDSITEDLAASLRLHSHWRSVYVRGVLATGLGPEDLPAYFAQQRRWATGTLQLLLRHWRTVFLPQTAGFRPAQRLHYALACTHYLGGVRDLIYLAVPVAILLGATPAIRGGSLSTFLWHFLPYWFLSQLAIWNVAQRVVGLHGCVIGFGSFPTLVSSLLTVLTGKRIGFAVTNKQQDGTCGYPWRHLVPQVAGLVLCVIALTTALFVRKDQASVVLINTFWVLNTLGMLAAMFWIAKPVQSTPGRATSKHHKSPLTRRTYLLRLAGSGLALFLFGVVALAAYNRPVLVWSDEFNGTRVDLSKWNVEDDIGKYNQERQYYASDEVFVREGHLVLRSRKRNYKERGYTSGRVDTRDKFSFTCGRVEVRARLPRGKGVWPAHWALPQDGSWPPEIDIMEMLGHDPSTVYMTNHWGEYPQHHNNLGRYTGPDFSGGWHVFACEWEPGRIRWYVDGVERHVSTKEVPVKPFFLVLNTAVGGYWPGDPDTTTVFPQYHEIDYVRVWQRPLVTTPAGDVLRRLGL